MDPKFPATVLGFIATTIWITDDGMGEFHAMNCSGEVIAKNKFKSHCVSNVRELALDPKNGIFCIAEVVHPGKRHKRGPMTRRKSY